MLTENELAWLEIRQHHETPSCISCECLSVDNDGVAWCTPQVCPLELKVDDVLEAAEFEARVAVKLANYIETLGWKGGGKHALKLASLAVEEEMNGQTNVS